MFFYACEEPNIPKQDTKFIVKEFYDPLKIIEVDSCEYLFGDWGDATVLTHKGNCKFCVARKHQR